MFFYSPLSCHCEDSLAGKFQKLPYVPLTFHLNCDGKSRSIVEHKCSFSGTYHLKCRWTKTTRCSPSSMPLLRGRGRGAVLNSQPIKKSHFIRLQTWTLVQYKTWPVAIYVIYRAFVCKQKGACDYWHHCQALEGAHDSTRKQKCKSVAAGGNWTLVQLWPFPFLCHTT